MSASFFRRHAGNQLLRRFTTAQRQPCNVAPALWNAQPRLMSTARPILASAEKPSRPAIQQAVHQMRAQDILAAANQKVSAEASTAAEPKVAEKGFVFEIGFTFLFSHYMQIFIMLARNAFQTFRPLFLAFVMGQLIKGAFFSMGLPMLVSFYSVWMFEVLYGCLQCFISFLFVSMFYNNLAFRGARPLMNLYRNRAQAAYHRLAARFM